MGCCQYMGKLSLLFLQQSSWRSSIWWYYVLVKNLETKIFSLLPLQLNQFLFRSWVIYLIFCFPSCKMSIMLESLKAFMLWSDLIFACRTGVFRMLLVISLNKQHLGPFLNENIRLGYSVPSCTYSQHLFTINHEAQKDAFLKIDFHL